MTPLEILSSEVVGWAQMFIAFGGTGLAIVFGVMTLRWCWVLFWDILNADHKHRG